MEYDLSKLYFMGENCMAKNTINRSIYYYDVAAFENLENNKGMTRIKDQSDVIIKCFEAIDQLNKNLERETDQLKRAQILQILEQNTVNGDKLYLLVDNIDKNSGIIRFRIILCRLDALPFIEQSGQLTNIVSIIDGDFNIAEITHCVMFTKYGVMGAEFNFNGARPSAIACYLPKFNQKMVHFSCVGKMRKDAFERLIDEKECSLFELGVKNSPEMRKILRDDMGMVQAFTQDIPEIDTYEIVLKRRITKKKKGFILPVKVEKMREFVSNNIEQIEKFKVSQGTYKDSIDLLSDKIVCKSEFVLTENRSIDSESIYGITENYFDAVVIKDCREENEEENE